MMMRHQRLGGPIVDVLRHHNVVGEIVRTARAKHKRIHAHAHMLTLRFDALPDEHAGARVRVAHTRFRADFKISTAARHSIT